MTKDNNVQFEKHNKYIERFDNPDFTAYDFLSLFSALNALQKEYSFDRDSLINFINFCKKGLKFSNLLNDIHLKSNGISYYSEEFDEAIGKLKWGNILYTISPERDSTICIFEDIPTSKLIEPRRNYLEEATCFVEEYNAFKKNANNIYQKKGIENEEWIEAIRNHYTNLGIEYLPIKTYSEPFYFGRFKNLDGSVNIAYLVLQEGIPTYVIIGEKASLTMEKNNKIEYEVKVEITKVEDAEDIDEFVYTILQDSTKNLEEKVSIIISYSFIRLIRK